MSFVSLFLDKHFYMCNKGRLILYLHHLLNIFANFGWLSNTKSILIVYLIAPVVCLLHWYTNNNLCYFTQKYNDVCNLSKDATFNDFFNIIGLKKYQWWMKYGHHIYLVICLCIAFVKLY